MKDRDVKEKVLYYLQNSGQLETKTSDIVENVDATRDSVMKALKTLVDDKVLWTVRRGMYGVSAGSRTRSVDSIDTVRKTQVSMRLTWEDTKPVQDIKVLAEWVAKLNEALSRVYTDDLNKDRVPDNIEFEILEMILSEDESDIEHHKLISNYPNEDWSALDEYMESVGGQLDY